MSLLIINAIIKRADRNSADYVSTQSLAALPSYSRMGENGKINFSLSLIIVPILLSVYGQLIIKWRVSRVGPLPVDLVNKIGSLTRLLLDPWIISVMVAAPIAALTWFAAMSKYELSYAYPFVSLAFVLILTLSAVFFHESVTVPKVLGVLLVTAGLIVASQG